MKKLAKQIADLIIEDASELEYSNDFSFSTKIENQMYYISYTAEIEEERWDENRGDWGVETMVKYHLRSIYDIGITNEEDELTELAKEVYKLIKI